MSRRHHKIPLFALAALLMLGLGCAPAPTPSARPMATATKTTAKTVILSFDADMTPAMVRKLNSGQVKNYYDPTIINLLISEKIPARVFVTGLFAETYPELVKRLATFPFITIGNHTFDHAAFEPNCYGLGTVPTDDAKKNEIAKTQTILKKMTGTAPTLFRYPGLCHNMHDDALVAALGLTVDDGNLTSGDAFNKHPDRIVAAVVRHAKNNSDILFHLGGPDAPATAAALPVIIKDLQAEGFVFKQ